MLNNNTKIFNVLHQINTLGAKREPFFFMIDFEQEMPVVAPIADIDKNEFLFSFPKFSNASDKIEKKKISLSLQKPDYITYKEAFDIVMSHIKYGDTFLLNLTFPVTILLENTLLDIFYGATAKYKIWYKNKFLVFSPETFVKTNGNNIYTFPMKGTIDANLPNAEQVLLNDEKELAEHYTIVDLLRNDLSIISTKVKVSKFRYIDVIHTNKKNLLQTSSEITGVLDSDWKNKIGDIIFKLLPAGSVSGAPKQKTLEIISKAENLKRGFYTGVAGYFDGENIDSCVMIRYIEKINAQYYYRAGGGITCKSDCLSEYQELINKVYVPSV